MSNTEDKIRQDIRNTLSAQYYYRKKDLHESYGVSVSPGEFDKMFIAPFRESWKGIFAELKMITSSALTAVRLAFTLNQKKAQEIWARQKDREKQFKADSDAAMAALGPAAADFNGLLFILTPGPWMAKQIGSTAGGFVNFAKEIGIGDKSIATQKGEEAEEDALIRRREQDGPVKKALRALEQIFFLAHAEPQGPLLSEATTVNEDEVGSDIMSGPLGSTIIAQQKILLEDIGGLVELINSIAPQNAFLSTIARVETAQDPESGLQEMETALKQFAAQNPEGAKEFSSLPADIRREAASLASEEKFQDELAERSEEQTEEIDYEKEALKAVLGASFGDNLKEYMGAIVENNELIDETFQAIFGANEIDGETFEVVSEMVKDFNSSIRLAEKILQRRLVA